MYLRLEIYYPDKDNTATQKQKQIVNLSLVSTFVRVGLHENVYSLFLYKHVHFICVFSIYVHRSKSLPCVKYSTNLLHSLQKFFLKMLSLSGSKGLTSQSPHWGFPKIN